MKQILILSVIIVVFLTGCNYMQKQVCINDYCFNVELAQTDAERQTGLMDRSSLEENSGMLFVFDNEEIHAMWMRNTLIPLDMIWISSNKEVVYINANTQPCESTECGNIIPTAKAKYVLELNAGTAEKAGLKIGDRAVF